MKTFRLQRRLAAAVMKCGKTRVWLDPLELKELGMATNRRTIKKMCKDGLIRKKQQDVHSRFRTRKRNEEKRRGRHTGRGKRRGCAGARMP